MNTQIRLGTLLLALGGTLCPQTRPAAAPPADHPSNGVVEMTVKPDIMPREHEMRHEGASAYAPWRGILEITIRNVSRGEVHFVELGWYLEYRFEVLDSEGRPVPLTPWGKTALTQALDAHPTGLEGPASKIDLNGGYPELTQSVNLSELYQLQPGQAYKIRIRRSKGLPTVDEAGKPLRDVELRCTVDVPDYGILR